MIEEGHRRVALIKAVEAPGRSIDEYIALLSARGSVAVPDEDFADDLEAIIAERKPLDTSAWEEFSTPTPLSAESEKSGPLRNAGEVHR